MYVIDINRSILNEANYVYKDIHAKKINDFHDETMQIRFKEMGLSRNIDQVCTCLLFVFLNSLIFYITHLILRSSDTFNTDLYNLLCEDIGIDLSSPF